MSADQVYNDLSDSQWNRNTNDDDDDEMTQSIAQIANIKRPDSDKNERIDLWG
jgi:hypothetical protein